jgi:hypothetical protein
MKTRREGLEQRVCRGEEEVPFLRRHDSGRSEGMPLLRSRSADAWDSFGVTLSWRRHSVLRRTLRTHRDLARVNDAVMDHAELRRRRRILLGMLTTPGWKSPPDAEPELIQALRGGFSGWPGIGRIVLGMSRQGYGLQLTQYGEEGWRANFYPAGARALNFLGHSPFGMCFNLRPKPYRALLA